MGKLTEILSALNAQIGNDKLGELITTEAVTAIEIDDEAVTDATTKLKGLLTIDAAKNNTDIQAFVRDQIKPAMRRDLLGNIDVELLQASRDLYGDEATSTLSAIEFTSDRVKKFAQMAKDQLSKGVNDKKLKEINDGLKNQINKINAEFATKIEAKDAEVIKVKKGFTDKLIKNKVTSMLSSYKYGEKYDEDFIKQALFDDVFRKIQKQAKLTLSADGTIVPKNPENPELDIYVNNNKVTELKEIIEPLLEPFIKKSDGRKPEVDGKYVKAKDTEMTQMAKDLISRRAEM